MSKEALAWAAGLFDGEGWASAARYSRKTGGMTSTPVAGVGQAHREVLDRFAEAVGIGRVRGPHEPQGMFTPALRLEGENLHCDDGPAVFWPNGARYWFWRGVQVPQQVIETPNALTGSEILGERNVEVRRVMIERFGADRLLQEARAKLVQQDDFGKLWRLDFVAPLDHAGVTEADDEPLVMVECVDPSTERTYHLRVPPHCKTAKGALGWTFDVDGRSYRPKVEA